MAASKRAPGSAHSHGIATSSHTGPRAALAAVVLVAAMLAGSFLPVVSAHAQCAPPETCTPLNAKQHSPDLAASGPPTITPDDVIEKDTVVDVVAEYINAHEAVCDDDDDEGCSVEEDFNVTTLWTTARLHQDSASALESIDWTLFKDGGFFQKWGQKTHEASSSSPFAPGDTGKLTVSKKPQANVSAGDTVTIVPVVDFCPEQLKSTGADDTVKCAVDETSNDDSQSEVNLARPLRFYVSPFDVQIADFKATAEVVENNTVPLEFTLDNAQGRAFDHNVTVELIGPGGNLTPINHTGGEPEPQAINFTGIAGGGTTYAFDWNTAGQVGPTHLQLKVTYSRLAVNAPVLRHHTNITVKAPDFLSSPSTETPAVLPRVDGDPTETFRFNATVANGGTADAAAVDRGPVSVQVLYCNLLKSPGKACDPDVAGDWTAIDNGTIAASDLAVGALPFPKVEVPWDPIVAAHEIGLFRIRTFADENRTFPELDESNNNGSDVLVQSSAVRLDPVLDSLEVLEPEATVSYQLQVTNTNTTANDFVAFKHPGSAKQECKPTCGPWSVRVLNATFSELGASNPFTLQPDETETIIVNVTAPDTDVFQGGQWARHTIAVCQVPPDDPDAPRKCRNDNPVDGTAAVLNTTAPAVFGVDIKEISDFSVQAEGGDRKEFQFRLRNTGNLDDRYDLNVTFASGSNTQAEISVVNAQGDVVEQTTTIPDDTLSSKRWFVRVDVAQDIPQGEVIRVLLNATSVEAQELGRNVSAVAPIEIGIGVDVSPPRISAVSPSGGAVVPSGTNLTYDVSDAESEVSSVTVSVDGGSFRTFEAPYTLDTTGQPEGELRVVIKAVDKPGNAAQKTFRYTIDDTAPRFQAVELVPSVVRAGGTLDLLVSLDEANPETLQAVVGDQTVSLQAGNGSNLWQATDVTAPSSEDLYNVRFTAVDAAGNQGEASRELEVVLPDVRILPEDFSLSPRGPRTDQVVTIEVLVTNPSPAKIQDYPVALFVDGEEFNRKQVTLDSNAKTQITFEWKGSAGEHDGRVVADPEESFLDASRGNNAQAFTVRVRGQGLLGVPGFETYIIAAALVFGALGWRRWDARNAHERDP